MGKLLDKKFLEVWAGGYAAFYNPHTGSLTVGEVKEAESKDQQGLSLTFLWARVRACPKEMVEDLIKKLREGVEDLANDWSEASCDCVPQMDICASCLMEAGDMTKLDSSKFFQVFFFPKKKATLKPAQVPT